MELIYYLIPVVDVAVGYYVLHPIHDIITTFPTAVLLVGLKIIL
jgi:hypothetical protein